MPISGDSAGKLRWARYHLGVLQYSIDSFMESTPYSIRIHGDSHGGDYCILGKMLRSTPSDLPLMIGDVVHSTRCALDYIPYRLSTLPPNSTDRSKLQFPLCGSFEAWTRDLKNGRLKGVGASAIAAIDAFQPYRNPVLANDALFLLSKLSNADKHHALRVVVARAKLTSMTFSGRVGSNEGVSIRLGTELLKSGRFSFGDDFQVPRFFEIGNGELGESETPLVQFVPAHPASPEMQAYPHISVQVQFARGQQWIEGHEVVSTLRLIVERAEEVCRQLP